MKNFGKQAAFENDYDDYNEITHIGRDNEKRVTINYFKKYYQPLLYSAPDSPGMDGKGVKNQPGDKKVEEGKIEDYGFNELSSSKISLERTVPDNRDKRYNTEEIAPALPSCTLRSNEMRQNLP